MVEAESGGGCGSYVGNGLGGSTAQKAGCTACGTQRWYRSEGRLYRSCRDSTQHETGHDFVAEVMVVVDEEATVPK